MHPAEPAAHSASAASHSAEPAVEATHGPESLRALLSEPARLKLTIEPG